MVKAANLNNEQIIIRRKLLSNIANNYYERGTYLPSIRQLAESYQVNPARVYRVINDLCRSDVLAARHGQGVLVKNPAKAIELLETVGSKTIAFTMPDWIRRGKSNPHFSEVLRGAEEVASLRGYHIIYATVHLECDVKSEQTSESEEQLSSPQSRFFHEKEIEGILLVGPIPEHQVRKFVSAHPVPTVCVDNAPEMKDVTCVTSSNFYGAMHATDYLISRGHHQIGYITANREQLCVDERLMGFRASMYKHHIENEIAFVKEMDFSQDTFEGGYEFAKELICSGMIEKASAILTTNDNVSAGLLKGLVDRGVKVPEDVSIMGFGNDPMGLACQPALTTMEVQSYRMGKIAMEILLDIVVMGKSPGELIMLPMRVIERDSVKDC